MPSDSHFVYCFHDDRDAKRKTRNSENHSHRKLVLSKDIAQQFRYPWAFGPSSATVSLSVL